MDTILGGGRYVGAICLAAAGLAACSGGLQDPVLAASIPAQANIAGGESLAKSAQPEISSSCVGFSANFDEAAACQRADGTIRTFEKQAIAWRVRYFVRYSQMPCGEYPTVQESYIFHMVVGDIDNDGDLTKSQRAQIRTAMFDGQVHCK